MPFSPTDIAYFLAIADTQHFGRAALRIGVTQPALTKAMRRLEAAVGVSLFERGAGGARLTSAGELFLERAQAFDRQHAALGTLADELRAQGAGLLRVGLANPDSNQQACAALAELVRQRPGLRLSLKIATSDVLDVAVDHGELDLAVAPVYPGHRYRCDPIPFGEDRVLIAARAGHPLAGIGPITFAQLEPYGWVMPERRSASRRLVTDLLERAGLAAPSVVIEAEFVSSAALNIVAATNLLIAVPSGLLAHWSGRVHALPLAGLDFARGQALLVRPGVRWTPIMAAFRELLAGDRSTRSG